MEQRNMKGGVGPKELLLAVIVILVAAALLAPAFLRIQNRNLLLTESGRMRQVYIALSFYEEQYDNQPTPNLLLSSQYDPNRYHYLSTLDPFANTPAQGSGFPVDAGLDTGEYSPFRISFSYRQDFVRTGKLASKPWAEVRVNPRIGEIADEWYGYVRPGEPFHADVGGRLLRVNTDGSVYVVRDRGGPKPLGDAQDLFIRR